MNFDFHLRCLSCEAESPSATDAYVCPKCSENCEVVYENPRIFRDSFRKGVGIARYEALLPHRAESLPPLPVGPTPIIAREDLAEEFGFSNLWIKDDGRLPSASFKDRASAVVLARAKEIGAREICTASTGNAAAALACLGASAGVRPFIFVPKSAPAGKIAQLVTFGARIFLVDGTYDDACDVSLAASRAFGWYNRSTGYNPYTREGKKTVSFEILEQLDWNVPDWVIVSVGDGNIISGVYKGFREAKECGLSSAIPRMVAAQSELSSAVSQAVNGDGVIRKVSATTLADSISVDLPRDGHAAVRAVLESRGIAVTVSDDAILQAQRSLASRTGIFAEPAAACSYAALLKAVSERRIPEGDSVLVIITGNGLKDVGAVSKRLPQLPIITPDVASVEKALKSYL